MERGGPSDTMDERLTEPNGRKLSFRERCHLACDRNPMHASMERDLCESEPQDKPENPASEPAKSVETNKAPVQVKKKPIDCSQRRAHFLGAPVEKITGCLSKFKHGVIRIRTDKPDCSNIPKKELDWFCTCCAGAREAIPEDCPAPRGNSVVTATCVGANLFHDMISG